MERQLLKGKPVVGKFFSAIVSREDSSLTQSPRLAIKPCTLLMVTEDLLRGISQKIIHNFTGGIYREPEQSTCYWKRGVPAAWPTLPLCAVTNMHINSLHPRNRGEEVSVVTAKSWNFDDCTGSNCRGGPGSSFELGQPEPPGLSGSPGRTPLRPAQPTCRTEEGAAGNHRAAPSRAQGLTQTGCTPTPAIGSLCDGSHQRQLVFHISCFFHAYTSAHIT